MNLGSGSARGVIVARDGRKRNEPKRMLPLASLSISGSDETPKRC